MADDAARLADIKLPRSKGGFFARSLSQRVLRIAIIFVFVAESVILVPSLGGFHRMWLQDRVNGAQIAALALDAAPDATVTSALRVQLLENAEVLGVELKRRGQSALRLIAPEPAPAPAAITHTIDLRDQMMMSVYDAFGTIFAPPGRHLRVLATPRFQSGEVIEVIVAEAPLKRDLELYAGRVLRLSLFVSVFTGLALYLVLNWMFVRPMRRLTEHIERFRERPQDVSLAIIPSGRVDEIGRAEHALADMEAQVRSALRQRERLAGLGAAVAKLAHDLRNSLSTAALVTERLAQSEDPRVRQTAPRLERALSRAAGLAEAALRYGRAEESPPRLMNLPLTAALDEAASDAMPSEPLIQWRNLVPADVVVIADADHLHRIATNLIRNAAEALAGAPAVDKTIEARMTRKGKDTVVFELADNGPGLAQAAQARLFEPFSSGGSGGGVGLGLSIARELARAQGGDLDLVATGESGCTFAIRLRLAPALARAET